MAGDPLREQYEAYPYPRRRPADEARRLVVGSPSHAVEIEHYLFAGRRDIARGFRALFAGGGTGDGTIMLAQQLARRGGDAEIVHLDLSRAAQDIARARAAARGLGNVRFVHGSILDLPALGLGRFDYVDCCGVLHHLEDPGAGLRALAAALAPDGGMGLMVYGDLGRTGVYDVQAMLRMIDGDADDAPRRLARARRLLADLPETNRLRRNPFVRDHLQGDDAGLFDLLLHSRDRAFRVPEVAALVAGAGLAIAAWIEPARYDPASYLRSPEPRARAAALPPVERAAFAELLAGNMKRHVLYVVPEGRGATVALPDSDDAVPVLREDDGPTLARGLKPGGTLTAGFDGLELSFPLSRLGPAILARIDGRRSIGEIHADLAAGDPTVDRARLRSEFDRLYAVMNGINALLLRRY